MGEPWNAPPRARTSLKRHDNHGGNRLGERTLARASLLSAAFEHFG